MSWLSRILRRPETRAQSYTALATLARAETITGASGAAELTATVQTAAGLWEGALALADVRGTDLLDAPTLALMGRSLALRGEFVGLLEGDRIAPASDWDLTTSAGRPRAYRLSLPDVGGGRTLTALAPEVLHVALGVDARQPWQGVSPLRRASLTADTLATVERALFEAYRDAALGSVVAPMPEMLEEDRERLAGSFRGQRGRVLIRESAATTAGGGPVPMQDWRPAQLSPDLRDSMANETLDGARRAILAAYGVLPAMLEANAGGPLIREAQRHLATWALQPVARLIGAEASAKLGAPVALDVLAPLQAYDAGGRARAASGIVKALAEAKDAGLDPATVAKAFALVGWQTPQE